MEDRIRIPGSIAGTRDELDLDELDQVAGGLDRAWVPAEPRRDAPIPLAAAPSAPSAGS
ncbi:hypothetical protein [Longimicrobium sp.]|uniref:hypothetical protein n=1 Tax=Longimicrobium sp. TaxID=2029185 RepID=UPI002BB099AB|nr:hypothetical protein [Longimicrobium sp.]HSU14668.1 hypothetical protein [Longimicrobium sp.]